MLGFLMTSMPKRKGQSNLQALTTLKDGQLAVTVMANSFGRKTSIEEVAAACGSNDGSLEVANLAPLMKLLDLKHQVAGGLNLSDLVSAPKPAIVVMHSNQAMILPMATEKGVRLVNPTTGLVTRMPRDIFENRWSGIAITVTGRQREIARRSEEASRRWFVDAVLDQKGGVIGIMSMSLILQITGIISPLLFQVIIDKVLLHRSTSTLNVVCSALVCIAIIESVLQWLRTYNIARISAKVDARMGSSLFAHLIALPMRYFDSRPAGQTVARVRELENVRSFLTGQGATAIVDAIFACLYLVVLTLYSTQLAVIMFIALPTIFFAASLIRFPMRTLIHEKFRGGARMQQYLIEAILGSHTFKAMALEKTALSEWEERLVTYVQSATKVSSVGALGSSIIQLVSKLSTAAILFFGASLVMDGKLSVGALVAFNMISNQLMAPTLRLSGMWQDLQQVQLSMERIGDILSSEIEFQPDQPPSLPSMKGNIELSNAVFRYSPKHPEVLKGISLKIPAGQVVGVVGESGSGKSTLGRVIQRLHEVNSGKVKIDNYDLMQIPTDWFRRNIGVVLQETFLMNRSIHENIAIGKPHLNREAVMQFAKLAGADEFISALPLGYDTEISERGANLSGGQRQRIAIARALAVDPRILIFDEATSALDLESEQAIQRNMRAICAGRTVIIIAHRLAALRDCDRLICLQSGRIVDDGAPADLAADPDSLFSKMLRQQQFPSFA